MPSDAVTTTVNVRSADAEAPSVTRTVKLKLPAAVGAPPIKPEADNVTPGGKAPDTNVQMYGGSPPEALSC